MGAKTVYDCDWCGVDTPDEEHVKKHWTVYFEGTLLCPRCAAARETAIEQEMCRATPPISGDKL